MKRQRTLVIVSKGLAPYRISFYNEVALSLAPHGWRVILLVAKSGAEDHPWADASGRHEALEIIEAAPSFPSSKSLRLVSKLLGASALPNSNLVRCLEAERPEVVWTHEYSPFCLTAALWASLRDKVSILSSDLGDDPPAYAVSRPQLRLQRLLSFLYQAVIAQTMEASRRQHPEGAPQCFAPHSINTGEYLPAQTPPEGPFRFLFTGALSNRKGLDSLVEAARILSRSGAIFELRVVGTGPLAQWLGEQTDPWLSIAGFREGADLIQEYQSAHAYVLPTRGDTYAVTVHEAAASGLPLIIGREAGAAETLVEEGASGYAIDPEDVSALAARMKVLLENPQRARTMGLHARELAEGLDVKLLGRRTADFIRGFSGDTGEIRRGAVPANPETPDSLRPLKAPAIAAIFATMNRAKVAVECLRLLSIQSQRPGKLFVTDNASSDDTAELLESASREHGMVLCLIRSAENLGNAGGIKLAMEKAFEEGFDAVWILDDDSWPEERTLQELLESGAPEDGIRTSIVLAPDSNEVSWPCEVIGGRSHWETLGEASRVSAERLVQVRRSWLGALIPRSAYENVGPLNGDLFLRGEDEDYPRRLEKAGYRFWMAPASILRHPVAGPVVSVTLGDYKLWLEHNLQGDKLYYRIRNMLWIKRDESGPLWSMLLAAGYLFLLLRSFRPLRPALQVFREAVLDAFAGRLGKRR